MDRVAFEIFGLSVMWYGVLIAMGMAIGIFLALHRARQVGFLEDDLLNVLLIAIPSGIVGARIYYVIFNWSAYQGDWSKILDVRGGGLAIHGGLIGAILAAWIYCRIKSLSILQVLDIAAPSIVLAQAIGRWGNYINQEAHGGPTDLPWGILIDGVRVHPTFLYESLWNLGVFFLLIFLRDRKLSGRGQTMGGYLVFYSLGRVWIEGLRTDSLMLGPFRVAQLISLAMILAGGILIVKGKKESLE
jgi:prolipoprotein diacylglyceryl transferase